VNTRSADSGVAPRDRDEGQGSPSAEPRGRLESIDAFRGLTLLVMLLTPFTGSVDSVAWLRHAEWDGVTIADVIFPTFLVGSGISLALLLRDGFERTIEVRLARRFLLLVAAGLVYNAYGTILFGDDALRVTGVLQTIAVAGALAAVVLYLSGIGRPAHQPRWPVVAAVVVVTLAIYQALGATRSCVAGADPDRCSVWFGLDRAVFPDQQLYQGGVLGFDPEGVAMMLISATLVLTGWGVGRWVWTHRSDPLRCAGALVVAAGVLMMAGGVLDRVADPINKRLFTPSFVVFAAGAAIAVFTVVYIVVDVVPRRTEPPSRRPVVWVLVAFGRNALVVFLAERFILQTSVLVSIGDTTARNRILAAMPGDGAPADLALSVLLASVVGAIVCVLHRRRLYLVL
jgi:predicted acyltransferase